MNAIHDISKPKVSAIKCSDYQEEKVYKAVKRSVDLLGGMKTMIKKGDRVLLKPNLLSGKSPEKAVTTHPSFISATVRLVKEVGGIPYIGDSPGRGSLRKISEKTGIKEVALRTGALLMEFDKVIDVEHKQGHVFKRFEIARALFDADVVINLPKLKTHGQMLLTLGVKNNFGFVVGTRKAKWHLKAGIDVDFFAQMLLDIYLLVSPALTIVDGIVGMEGDGPGSGDPRELGLVFAGVDCVAVDTVISEVLGVDPSRVYTIKAARQRGVGQSDLNEIEVLGEDPEQIKIKDFKLPKTHDIGFNIPKTLSDTIKNLATSKPVIDYKKCGFCGTCVESCPPQTMKKAGKRIHIDYKTCIRCFCCLELCPEGAIQIKESWL